MAARSTARRHQSSYSTSRQSLQLQSSGELEDMVIQARTRCPSYYGSSPASSRCLSLPVRCLHFPYLLLVLWQPTVAVFCGSLLYIVFAAVDSTYVVMSGHWKAVPSFPWGPCIV